MKPFQMRDLHLNTTCNRICEICGKPRGYIGTRVVRHDKCAATRKARGFHWEEKK